MATKKPAFALSIADVAALRLKGINSIKVEYSGSGDSGQVDGVYVNDSTEALDPGYQEAIEDWAYRVIGDRHMGWENNDGASGAFTIDLLTGQVLHEHTTYYMESSEDCNEDDWRDLSLVEDYDEAQAKALGVEAPVVEDE